MSGTYIKAEFKNAVRYTNASIATITHLNRLFSIDFSDPELRRFDHKEDRIFRLDNSLTTKDTIIISYRYVVRDTTTDSSIGDFIEIIVDFASDSLELINNTRMSKENVDKVIEIFSKRIASSDRIVTIPPQMRKNRRITFYDIVYTPNGTLLPLAKDASASAE